MTRRLLLAGAIAAWLAQACGGLTDNDLDAGEEQDASADGPFASDATTDADASSLEEDAELDASVCPAFLSEGPCEGGACKDGSVCVEIDDGGPGLPNTVGCYPVAQCPADESVCDCVAACACGPGRTCIEDTTYHYYLGCKAQ